MNVELALKVRARILAEPQSVDMGTWLHEKRTVIRYLPLMGEEIPIYSCGTVGCVFGHTIIASGSKRQDYEGMPTWKVIAAGSALLGISEVEADMLFFFFMDTGGYADLAERLRCHRAGSRPYAAIVAEAIDRCIERNSPSEEEPDVCVALDAAGPVPVEEASDVQMPLVSVP